MERKREPQRILFIVYRLPARRVVHVVMVDRKTKRALAQQTAAILGRTARLFGTSRRPWTQMLAALQAYGWKPTKIRQAFLEEFERACRKEGARVLRGAVQPRLARSYQHWSGFRDSGKRMHTPVGELIVLEKVLT